MTRQMSDEAFRSQQRADRYADHIKPVNELVDSLRDPKGRGWMPHVAPIHGGIHATVLCVLRDPGPKTLDGSGSGFICTENDDPTAARMAERFERVGIKPGDITPWNAYPWYINKKPTGQQLSAGAETLIRLIELMPQLRVAFLQGNDAVAGWKKVQKLAPTLVADRQLEVVTSVHPGLQGLWTPNPAVRAARVARQDAAFLAVARVIGAPLARNGSSHD
jgi:hypothetical protein